MLRLLLGVGMTYLYFLATAELENINLSSRTLTICFHFSVRVAEKLTIHYVYAVNLVCIMLRNKFRPDIRGRY